MLIQNKEDVFSYHIWYPLFKNKVLTSVLIPLTEEVCSYLLEDSTLVLPQEVYSRENNIALSEDGGDCLVGEDAQNDTTEIEPPSFPEFSEALSQALESFGNEVFVKLNWSAPVDAAWITSSKSMKCTSIEDIYLVLKSSDILAKELSFIKEMQDSGSPGGIIVIKKWYDIYPGHEFRCFVMGQKLIAISQRDYRTYYGYIAEKKYSIIADIEKFFTENIKGKFPIENYVYDIWMKSRNRIRILDFSPFDSTKTKSLLFSWEELHELENCSNCDRSAPELRFLGEDPGFQPNPCQYYGVPLELGNLDLGNIDLLRKEYQDSEEAGEK